MAKFVRIVARRADHRRAGIAHPAEPQEYPADRFTAEQLAALKADPQLVVDEVDRPDAGAKGKGG